MQLCLTLTQGDNNHGDDRTLYNRGQIWLHQHHIMGRVVGYVNHLTKVLCCCLQQFACALHTVCQGGGSPS